MSCIGIVKKYDATKGFGFIVPSEDNGGQDLFVLRTDVIGGTLVAGDQVQFDEGFNERNGNAKAVNVTGGTGGMDPGKGGDKGGFGGKGKSKGGGCKGKFEMSNMMPQGGGFGGGLGGGLGGGGFPGMPGACAGGIMGGGFSDGSAKTGTVKFFNDAKGFGFITQDSGEPDLFVHRNDVQGQELMEGDRVQFTDVPDERSGRPKAQQVKGGTGSPLMNCGKGGGKGGGGGGKGFNGGKGKKGGKGKDPDMMMGGPGPLNLGGYGGQGCAPSGGQPGPMGPGGMQPGLGMMPGAGGLGMMQGGGLGGQMGQRGMAGLPGMNQGPGMGGFSDGLPERGGGMMSGMLGGQGGPPMFDDDFAPPQQACNAGKGFGGAPGGGNFMQGAGGNCMQGGMFDRFGPGGPQGIGMMGGQQPQPGQGGQQQQLGQGGLGGPPNQNFGGGMPAFSMGGGGSFSPQSF